MVDVIQELEHLKKLAAADPKKRFEKLYRLLRQPNFLALARERIAGNAGAQTPGVDRQTLTDITNTEVIRLSEELATKKYQPQPVRRVYIPKKNGKLRPLGIPCSRDKVVQSGVTMILESLFEPKFRNCSHGFRPGRSTITALRQMSSAYRAGAKWIIEGDITDCFGSIPHSTILNCLRKRIRDESFIDLIRKMLQAGVMEDGKFAPTYSGTPQGGIASPILSNIVLHELDVLLEEQIGCNPSPQTVKQLNARTNPEYRYLSCRISRLRSYLDGKRAIPKRTTIEKLRQELREKLQQRKWVPSKLPRKVLYYSRYADDFAIALCDSSKKDAQELKALISEWMEKNLGLNLNQEKTHITHWQEKVRFLGYELEGRLNPNGTGWLFLSIPKDAQQKAIARIEQATRYSQAPEYDVFYNVNTVTRGWTNYYRYAHNFSTVGGKLSMVIYWKTAHYLGKRHRRSISKIMRSHYDKDPKTGCKALFIYKPGQATLPENRYFIWHKRPKRLSFCSTLTEIQDNMPAVRQGWATGRSLHKKIETRLEAEMRCEQCGKSGVTLYVHHPNRLVNAKRVNKGAAHVAQSGIEQQTKLLCHDCHNAAHHYASS
jgi:group II intron reverse transcriptase/maturase